MESNVNTVRPGNKFLFKGLMIAGLVILLMLPTQFVGNLVKEREERQQQAAGEVSSKWAGPQLVTGPMLVLPYFKPPAGGSGNPVRHLAYFLPDELDIRAEVQPLEKSRGIYRVMLYRASLHLEGAFGQVAPERLGISPADIAWNEAFVTLYVGDIRGLNEELSLAWNNAKLSLVPGGSARAREALTARVSLNGPEDLKGIHFAGDFSLNGSDRLLFNPVGRTTTARMQSTWPHPSFTGSQLPQDSHVTAKGFDARWSSLSHSRRFPQQWTDDEFVVTGPLPETKNSEVAAGNSLSAEAFGTGIFVPVNGYQKTMRSVKYGLLCIVLTFAAFFIIETIGKQSVHPLHYALVGLALVLFYTLLLSISEYTGFDIAYLVSACATIGLITWFVRGVLHSSRRTGMMGAVLTLLYAYVFTTLQLQDYSLLLGSMGLFLTLAVVMQLSKRIQW